MRKAYEQIALVSAALFLMLSISFCSTGTQQFRDSLREYTECVAECSVAETIYDAENIIDEDPKDSGLKAVDIALKCKRQCLKSVK